MEAQAVYQLRTARSAATTATPACTATTSAGTTASSAGTATPAAGGTATPAAGGGTAAPTASGTATPTATTAAISTLFLGYEYILIWGGPAQQDLGRVGQDRHRRGFHRLCDGRILIIVRFDPVRACEEIP